MTDSMMPEGVEHKLILGADESTIVVTDSMMPEGVEHLPAHSLLKQRTAVTDSMMPEGVEHVVLALCVLAHRSDRFHDAGRR